MLDLAVILAAGFWAGMINTVVGSGTLVTFPVLVLFGYPPLVANVSNNVGLVAGNLSGAIGYRTELTGRGRAIGRLLPASALGGITGALVLLVLPAAAFRAIVPALIVIGLVMVVFGPALQRRFTRAHAEVDDGVLPPGRRLGLLVGVFLLGVYGGYFGAAQGVLLVGLLSVLTTDPLQTVNGLKNVLVTAVNSLAAITFMVVSPDSINWVVVLVIAVGATFGGVAGARFGRRLSPFWLRAIIVVVGLAALVRLVFFD